ncbi:MAG TPA: addiction module protein [Verrucomicrobiae bacterium]|nr:addiction module protein [Verrucomicrobiae bacterium]
MNALPANPMEGGCDPQVTPSQQAELDRRLKAHAENPDDVVPWEVVKASLDTKYGKP